MWLLVLPSEMGTATWMHHMWLYQRTLVRFVHSNEQSLHIFLPCSYNMTRMKEDLGWLCNCFLLKISGFLHWIYVLPEFSWSVNVPSKCGICLYFLANSKFIHWNHSLNAKFLSDSTEPLTFLEVNTSFVHGNGKVNGRSVHGRAIQWGERIRVWPQGSWVW